MPFTRPLGPPDQASSTSCPPTLPYKRIRRPSVLSYDPPPVPIKDRCSPKPQRSPLSRSAVAWNGPRLERVGTREEAGRTHIPASSRHQPPPPAYSPVRGQSRRGSARSRDPTPPSIPSRPDPASLQMPPFRDYQASIRDPPRAHPSVAGRRVLECVGGSANLPAASRSSQPLETNPPSKGPSRTQSPYVPPSPVVTPARTTKFAPRFPFPIGLATPRQREADSEEDSPTQAQIPTRKAKKRPTRYNVDPFERAAVQERLDIAVERGQSRRDRLDEAAVSAALEEPPTEIELCMKQLKAALESTTRDLKVEANKTTRLTKELKKAERSAPKDRNELKGHKEYQKKVEEGLNCPSCMAIMVGPHIMTGCGHSSCGLCAHNWFESRISGGQDLTCVSCRGKLDPAHPMTFNRSLQDLIQTWVENKMSTSDGMKDWQEEYDDFLARSEDWKAWQAVYPDRIGYGRSGYSEDHSRSPGPLRDFPTLGSLESAIFGTVEDQGEHERVGLVSPAQRRAIDRALDNARARREAGERTWRDSPWILPGQRLPVNVMGEGIIHRIFSGIDPGHYIGLGGFVPQR